MQADVSADIERGFVDVADVEGDVVGCVTYYPINATMHLSVVAVRPSHAGNGIGRQLIRHVEQNAAQAGLESVDLYTNAAMTENLDLYPRLGYVEVGRKVEAGFDRIYFQKRIGA